MQGKFITFEGIDGAGKSSHVGAVAANLRARGFVVHETREPGGTPLGEQLRALLLGQEMHLETEALLMFAARREHLAQVIQPALAKGEWVVCDRFTDASFAYQCGGRGLDKHKLGLLENWVQAGLQPDLTFLFDLPCDVARQRIARSQRSLDRFEQEQAQFHERVRQAYLERARAYPQRIRVVPGEKSLAEISTLISGMLTELCHAAC